MTLFTSQPVFNTLKVLKYFTVLLVITIFSGCAVSNFKTVNNTRLIDPYGKIAVIVINTQEELIDFTVQSFDDLVRPSLNDLKNIPGPKLLHVVTVKGKGFSLAEKDQTKWHAPGLFDKITGEIYKKKFDLPQPPKYRWLRRLR